MAARCPERGSAAGLESRHHQLLASELDPITRLQLAAAPLLQFAIDAHIALLDPEFGFAAGAHQALPFQKLIQAQFARLL
jgi:hypothetical protein